MDKTTSREIKRKIELAHNNGENVRGKDGWIIYNPYPVKKYQGRLEKVNKLNLKSTNESFEIKLNSGGATGKEEKILDLDLFAPLTGERAGVQIKAQSDLNEFFKYNSEFKKMNYDKLFFVAHTPKKNLLNHTNESETKLYFVDKIAELTLSAGLVDWIIKKSS